RRLACSHADPSDGRDYGHHPRVLTEMSTTPQDNAARCRSSFCLNFTVVQRDVLEEPCQTAPSWDISNSNLGFKTSLERACQGPTVQNETDTLL
ncbi:hypothetical protein IRJ41_020192, partial [Triplophysa rosa]